jgi:hypothetical protein
MSILVFSFFHAFFDWATDQTAAPILMVISTNEVVLHKEVPLAGHVDM